MNDCQWYLQILVVAICGADNNCLFLSLDFEIDMNVMVFRSEIFYVMGPIPFFDEKGNQWEYQWEYGKVWIPNLVHFGGKISCSANTNYCFVQQFICFGDKSGRRKVGAALAQWQDLWHPLREVLVHMHIKKNYIVYERRSK